MTCPRAIFLDGAGWFMGDGPVRSGLSAAGFAGPVERFEWSSYFGPIPDHIIAGPNHPKVKALADRITALRRQDSRGKIILISLSAGSGILIPALERLPQDVMVDDVVLLSPSISSERDLTSALSHVKNRLYATSSPYDPILAAAPSAGLEGGRPAGVDGFRLPRRAGPAERQAYAKVVNLPWRAEYVAYGWDGRHVSVTHSDFIRVVIAPRLLFDMPHPLDRGLGRS